MHNRTIFYNPFHLRKLGWLGLSIGLALLFLTGLVLGLKPASAAPVDAATWYVDAAGGVDNNSCGAMDAPCQSISYTLNIRAASGDTLLIAGGVYTENLTIGISVTLKGGYNPENWERDWWTIIDGSANGILPGDWDGDGVRYPMILKDGSTYKMWYDGQDTDGTRRIGYATSPDGIDWTRYGDPVLDVGAEGEWDSYYFEAPFVIKDSDTSYKMWYTGVGADDSGAVGYATSPDGVNWTKHTGNPVLEAGIDDWNNGGLYNPSVIQASGVYTMYFVATGDDGSGLAPHMAYATSPDGINWTMGDVLFGRTWETWMWRPFVLEEAGQYKMWYSLWMDAGLTSYATSPDGANWAQLGSAILAGTPGEWDDGFAVDPFVLPESGGYTMWYDGNGAIGRAVSTDGLVWTKPITSPVFTGGVPTQYGQPVITVDNPNAVVVLDGRMSLTGGAGETAGGLDAGDATVTIRKTAIGQNQANGAPDAWGAGGVLMGSGNLTIEDSWIFANVVKQGASAVRVGPGTLVLTNTVVTSNHGDAALHLNGSASLMNVTIADNDGGVTYNSPGDANLSVVNSIIYGNGSAIQDPGEGTVNVSYSDIEGGWPGVGNLDADPLYVDLFSDQRLKLGSPCIDTGTDSGAPDHDADGNSRPLDGNGDGVAVTDMGAHELMLYQGFLPLITNAH